MRFIRVMVVVILFVSMGLNVFLYRRTERLRPQAKINDTVVTKKEYHDWLEQQYGTNMMATIVKYNLVTQAAKKAGISPGKEEIDEQVSNYMELNPRAPMMFRAMPWAKIDVERNFEMNLALANLTTKDVKATDGEIADFFRAARGKWDHPTKLRTKILRCADAATAGKAVQVVKQLVKPAGNGFALPDLAQVAAQYPGKAEAMFGDGTWVLWRPYNRPAKDALIDFVSAMKPGEIKLFPLPNANGVQLVIALEGIDQGRAAQVTEPSIRKRVERDYRLTRATPAQEIMRGLWDTAKIEVENDALKTTIERLLLPERAQLEQQASLSP